MDAYSLEHFKDIIKSGDFVILDTETTGLHQGEICQIAIVDSKGEALLYTLLRTKNSIPKAASAVHGITDEMVIDCAPFSYHRAKIQQLLSETNVFVYNAVYDRKMLHQTNELWGFEKIDWKAIGCWWCVMEMFATVYGDYNEYHHSYRWQRLETAAQYYNVQVAGEHDALADCLMTLGVVRGMAAIEVNP